MTTNVTPFACDMNAIQPDDRPKHLATIQTLFGLVQEVTELQNGYRFRLPVESHVWMLATDFVALERLCCPFFDFNLGVEREHGSIHLSLTGREGVKPFIMAEVGSPHANQTSFELNARTSSAVVLRLVCCWLVALYAMMSLYFCWYNFCRIHSSIRCTPAMESGLTAHVWTLRELLA